MFKSIKINGINDCYKKKLKLLTFLNFIIKNIT